MPENPEPEWNPDELLAPDPTWGGFNMGQWGYQLLRDRATKVKKKNPIGFAVPAVSDDEPSISSNPIEDSNNS